MNVTGIVVDTSAYSEFVRGDTKLLPYMNPQHQLHFPLIVLGELRAGFENGKRTKHNNDLLDQMLNVPTVDILPITEQTTIAYARLYATLRSAGTPMGTNDMWIAALCLENKLPLLTTDTDFTRVTGLRIFPA